MDKNGDIHHSNKKIADILCEQYQSMFSVKLKAEEYEKLDYDYYNKKSHFGTKSMETVYFSREKIQSILKGLKPNSVSGLEGYGSCRKQL